jgi:SAM-dependent methyltransferase
MKKFIVGLILVKLTLVSLFFAFSFPSLQSAKLAETENQIFLSPSPTPQTQNDNIDRPTSEPYKGDLSIFEDAKRSENLQIERVMDILKISEGKSVVDLGAGSGWFTVRAAKRIGAKGKVFAVEISEDAIKYINERKTKENLPNIETVLGTEDDPKLPKNSVDSALILKTYHEISQPVKVLKNLLPALKENAIVGIIDRNGEGNDHGIKKETVIEEMNRAGFALAGDYDFVKGDGMDYFLVFQVKK